MAIWSALRSRLVRKLDPALEAAQVERAPDKRGRRKKTTLDLKLDMTTDSLSCS